jgi:hypothetical protein
MEIVIKAKSKEDLLMLAKIAKRMGLTSSITNDEKADAVLLTRMKRNKTGKLLYETESKAFVGKLKLASGK